MRAVLRDTLKTFTRHGGRVLGGAIAFYSLLSIAPLLVIVIHFAGVLTGADHARVTLTRDLARWIGEEGAGTIASLLARADRSGRGPLSSTLSAVLLVYASTACSARSSSRSTRCGACSRAAGTA